MSTSVKMIQTRQSSTKNTARNLLWVSPLAMVAATIANLALYYTVGALFPSVTAWSGAGPAQIFGANVVYLLMGAITLLIVARISSSPARHFVQLALVGLLLSLALPIGAGFGNGTQGASPAGVETVITLSLMHVISAAITVPLFTRYALR